jgi:hypothetical protein
MPLIYKEFFVNVSHENANKIHAAPFEGGVKTHSVDTIGEHDQLFRMINGL